jgi:hypothetical protein
VTKKIGNLQILTFVDGIITGLAQNAKRLPSPYETFFFFASHFKIFFFRRALNAVESTLFCSVEISHIRGQNLGKKCGTVVERLAHNREIDSSNPATGPGPGRDKMVKKQEKAWAEFSTVEGVGFMPCTYSLPSRGMYFKHITITNDASRVVSE